MSSDIDDNHILIEYHDTNHIEVISYTEFITKEKEVVNLLTKLLTTENIKHISQCIAINCDIIQYCIPILISGIVKSNSFSFTFKPSKASIDVCNKLTINLIFSHHILTDYNIVYQLDIHNQSIYLLKHKYLRVKEIYSVEYSNSAPFKFCYFITTSGTTASPKIVRVTHDCILPNISDFSLLLNISSIDKIAQLTPLTFDPSMIEIFLSIKSSCTLFMVSEKIKNDPQLLMDKMIDNRVTIYQTTPSLLLSKWSKEKLKTRLLSKNTSLRALLLGGEPFIKFETISEIKDKENVTKLFNVYGITEVSCWSSLNEVVPEIENIKTNYIGKSLSETILQVRNSDNSIIRDGEGVLYIGSQTRICQIDDESIITNNLPLYRNTGDIVKIKADKIYYVGRADDTIKRLGNKLNLRKLEKCVESNDMITQCASVWDEENHKLYIFVIPSSNFFDVRILRYEIRKQLRNLVEFYQPDEIHCIKSFPLTEHGKISKSILKQISIQREKPLEHLKSNVQRLWEEYLLVSNDDGFLNLGGNSISAIQMSNILSDLLNADLSGLTAILLSNGNFSECLSFISNKCNVENHVKVNVLEHSQRNSIVQTSSTNTIDQFEKQEWNSNLKCMWQKNRGDNGSRIMEHSKIDKIIIGSSFDLKKCVDASPTIFKCSSGTVFATVGSHSGIICTVSLNNSKSAECYQIKLPDRIEASVLVLDEFLGVVGCYDGYVYCLRLNTGDIMWKYQTGNMVKCTALVCHTNECLFVGSYDTYMYCLNIKNGYEIWKTKVSSGSITTKPRFNLDKSLLLVVTLDGTCSALDVKSGQVRWSKKLNHPIFSSPTVLKTGHVIFCTVVGNLICFDVERDIKLWSYFTNLNTFSYPVVHNDQHNNSESICIVSQDTLFRLNCDNINVHNLPTVQYKIKLKSTTLCTPWCEGNIIVLADSGGNVYVIDYQDGIVLAEITLKNEIFSSPILCDDNIVVGCRDNYLYLLKLLYS